ncbi:MAG: hypothetical protein JXQ73_33765 [Phycisphaerae bacterium]|nr:hypothetical protein [Phycisphaerae bacterium]
MYLLRSTAILALGLLVLVGCSQPVATTQYAAYAGQGHDVLGDREGRQPALLFDRVPGYPTASAFNYRSDWPSTDKGYSSGETLYYVTYVSDSQGTGWYNTDNYYRNARYYQVGRIDR